MLTENPYQASQGWPYHVSCGGVIYRENERRETEFALLYRKDEAYRGGQFSSDGCSWHLPKGTLGREETLELGARREIQEETGLIPDIITYLGALNDVWTNNNGMKIDKTTHYFLAKAVGGDASLMDQEHDGLRWFGDHEAQEKLGLMPKKEEKIIERACFWLENSRVHN